MAQSQKSAVAAFDLTIGKSFSNVDKLDVEQIVVDNLSDGPDMCYVRLNAHEDKGVGAWLDKGDIALGKPVEVKLGFTGKGAAELVFKGEVIGWEPSIAGKEPAGITVRAYNKLHRLSRGRKSRPFQEQKLSDIAKKVAGDWGLGTSGIEATTPKQPYVYQPSVTDLDFLRMLAARVGYEVRCDLKENLVFAPPKVSDGSVATFEWGKNLKRFKSRLSAGTQISKIKVTGWDVKNKKRLEATASQSDVLSSMGGSTKGPQAAAKFEKGEIEYHVQLSAVYSLEDMQQLAKGLMNLVAANYLVAELEAEGENKVIAGKVIEVKNVGKRFDGSYYVVGSRHILKPNPKLPDAGYVTEVTARRMAAGD